VTARPPGVDRVRTVFLGSGAFAIPSLRALADHPSVELVGVVTAPARPVGRRQVPAPTPLAAAADLPVPILVPARLRAPESVAEVLALEPGLAVLADYGQLVPPPILDLAHGALNLHPSLLPRHRGATPIPATILAGDTVTGVTLMRMDTGLDTGPIVATTERRLDGTETAPRLEADLADRAGRLLVRWLDAYLAGDRVPKPQAEDGATLTRPLRREDGKLDVTRSAIELERMVRAYEPWPGTWLETTAGKLGVLEAEVESLDLGGEPGHFLGGHGRLAVTTADGRLRLVRVRPEGGKPMDAAAFLNGRPAFLGEARVLR
jgi:methionyl-tRNA formyltransferase